MRGLSIWILFTIWLFIMACKASVEDFKLTFFVIFWFLGHISISDSVFMNWKYCFHGTMNTRNKVRTGPHRKNIHRSTFFIPRLSQTHPPYSYNKVLFICTKRYIYLQVQLNSFYQIVCYLFFVHVKGRSIYSFCAEQLGPT